MGKRKSNGEGSISKRPDGRFMGQITIGRRADGSLNRRTVYSDTKADVIKKMDAIKHELHTCTYVDTDNMTVKEWLLYWLTTYKCGKVKPKTYDNYEFIINYHLIPCIGAMPLQKLKNINIQLMYNEKQKILEASTISKINIVLKSALKKAITENRITSNPADDLEMPKVRKSKVLAFTRDEQGRFEASSKDSCYHDLFIVNLYTGLRCSEILPLVWKDIDFVKQELSVNKNLVHVKNRDGKPGNHNLIQDSTKSETGIRVIPLTKRCVDILKLRKLKYQAKSDYVFCSQTYGHVSLNNYATGFKLVLLKAGIEGPYNTHAMRHTFATRLFEQEMLPKTISEIMGHAKINITLDTYAHVLPNMKRAAIDSLENLNLTGI